MSHDEEGFRRFVEEAVGGRVVSLERTAVGSSRVTLLVDVEDEDGQLRAFVLRHDSGDGPLSGTDIDLAHEAVVYRALAEHPVRIPRLLAEASDGRTLLVERAPGTEAFADLPRAVEDDFGAALAELHSVDPGGLALGEMPRPATAPEHALLDLRRWAGFERERVAQPSEITRFSIDWLGEHAPARVDRTVLCHGDAGVGNFLHDGTRVTAILDWEFAHLGDPLDDVAWVLVRSHVTGGAPLRSGLRCWSEQTGLPLDPPRIAYYRALVLLRMAISCEIALSNPPKSAAMNMSTYEILLPYLGYLLPQALREAGCEGSGLEALEASTREAVEQHPVLKSVARPLLRWEES